MCWNRWTINEREKSTEIDPNIYKRYEYDKVEHFSTKKSEFTILGGGGKPYGKQQKKNLDLSHPLCQTTFLVQGCARPAVHQLAVANCAPLFLVHSVFGSH